MAGGIRRAGVILFFAPGVKSQFFEYPKHDRPLSTACRVARRNLQRTDTAAISARSFWVQFTASRPRGPTAIGQKNTRRFICISFFMVVRSQRPLFIVFRSRAINNAEYTFNAATVTLRSVSRNSRRKFHFDLGHRLHVYL